MKSKNQNLRRWAVILLATAASATLTGLVYAAAPLAGTTIGNQASATYNDDSGASRTATSNTVITVVQQVGAFDLVDNRSRTIAPGGTIYFPHTVTNLGNGPDTYNLAAVLAGGSTLALANITIFADADNNGIPDNFTPITNTGDIPAGGSFNFVIAVTAPGGALAGQIGNVTVTATSVLDGTVDTNTDTATLTADAVMVVTKAISIGSGFPGTDPVQYTLTYTNTGNNTATSFKLVDTVPANMTYNDDSARWSVTGPGVTLSDGTGDTQGTPPNQIDYSISAGVITAIITNVAPGQSGSLTFTVAVDAGIAPQVINNFALVSYDANGATPGGTITDVPTNIVPFVVLQVAGVNAFDPTDVAEVDEIVNAAAVIQGSTVPFTNRIKNTGTGIDTFDMTFQSNDYPAGTTFQFFKSDGNTPLVDTNGNSIPDTGPLAPGAFYDVVVKAFLPANATVGGPYTLTKRATSGFNPAVFDDMQDVLAGVTGKTVDLTNNAPQGAPGALGEGLNSGDALVAASVTNSTNPDTTTRFTLYVKNTSTSADAYKLVASSTNAFSPATMHNNWTVVFRDASEAIITGTGTINPGASILVYADVTVPAFEVPGNYEIYYQVLSLSSGAEDRKHDRVDVLTVRELGLVSDNAGQVFPGGSVVYTHLLTNLGNVTEADGGPSVVTLGLSDSLAVQGWTSVVYWDKNNDGILDASDPVVTILDNGLADWNGLSPNETQRFFTKVFCPLQADALTVNLTTITATTSGGPIDGTAVPPVVTNKDTTTVVKGDLSLLKEQAIDADPDLLDAGNEPNGVADGAYSILNINGRPGDVVVYRITVTNTGNTDATNILIYDSTPTGTTYYEVGADGTASVNGVSTVAAVPTKPANGATGAFQFNVGTLTPGASATIKFGVRIDPL